MSLPRSSGVFTKDLSEKEISTPEVEPLHKEEERSGRDALQSKVCPTIKKGHRLVSEKFPENQAVPYKEYGQNTNSSTSARPGKQTFAENICFMCFSKNENQKGFIALECCSLEMTEKCVDKRKRDGYMEVGREYFDACINETFNVMMEQREAKTATLQFNDSCVFETFDGTDITAVVKVYKQSSMHPITTFQAEFSKDESQCQQDEKTYSTLSENRPDHRKTFMPVESTPNVLPIENKISSTQAKCISHCGMKYQRASFTCYSINKSRQSKAVIECCSPDMLEDRFEQRKSDGFSNDGHFDVSARLGETFKIVMQGNFDQKADITFSKIFQEVEFPVKDFARNCVTIIVYKKDKHALQRFSIDRRNDVLEFKGDVIKRCTSHESDENITEEHSLKDDYHEPEKELAEKHYWKDLNLPGKEIVEGPVKDDLHAPENIVAEENCVEIDNIHVRRNNAVEKHHMNGNGVAAECHLKHDLDVHEKDVAVEYHLENELNMTKAEITDEHHLIDDVHVSRHTNVYVHREKDDLYVSENEVEEELIADDNFNVTEKEVAEKHCLKDDLHSLKYHFIFETKDQEYHHLEDQHKVIDNETTKQSPLEDVISVPVEEDVEKRHEKDNVSRKDVSDQDHVKDSIHVSGKEVLKQPGLVVVSHVPEQYIAAEYFVEDNLVATEITEEHQIAEVEKEVVCEYCLTVPRNEDVEEHRMQDVWDTCFKKGEIYIKEMLKRGLFPPVDILDELCDCYGRKSLIVGEICTVTKTQIKRDIETAFDTEVVDMYPAIKDGAKNKIMFVLTLSKQVNVAEIRERVAYVVEFEF
ncbi:uncharacterized protein LOC128240726 isoform X2 [Mya arenaria]|uniref:uncharacterized protein LOC128240726 isoform X2 n=1 Tax=Mya arenaria TaxID=6604 RepID=UPI0022E5A50C|nr:uncharacterized protein LOC128240726 isoform X2 [Mya arenaria]